MNALSAHTLSAFAYFTVWGVNMTRDFEDFESKAAREQKQGAGA